MRASIDIGSNSILLLVVDDSGKVVHDEARVVGLGKGLGERGVFRPERMEAAIACLKDYAQIARGADIRAVATSASRRALNAQTFYANVLKQTGIKVEVVSGDEEARLTYVGALDGLDVPAGPVLVCDPGGGSTEVIVGEGRQIHSRVSLEIGTVRLTEQYLGYGQVDPAALARLRAHVDAEVAKLDLPVQPRTAVAVAGTATTLAGAELGLTAYDPARVHGATLTNAQLRGWVDRLLEATPERRRQLVAVSPERADTVLAGAVILLRVLEAGKKHAWRISDRGLRYGLLKR